MSLGVRLFVLDWDRAQAGNTDNSQYHRYTSLVNSIMKMPLKLSRTILASSWLLSAILRADAAPSRPNIVFILTDDQDNHMGSLQHMPSLQKHLVHQGTTFERHYCSSISHLILNPKYNVNASFKADLCHVS